MSNDPLQTEKLIDYIDGNTPEHETVLLKQQLETDEAMQEELDHLLLARDVVKNYGLANQVAAVHTAMMKKLEVPAGKPEVPVRSLYARVIKYAAAAIILVGLFSIYQYLNVSADHLFNQQYTAYTLTTLRGDENSTAMEKAYTAKRFDEVIAISKQQPVASVKETFLTGQAYLAKQQYTQAVTAFKSVLEKNEQAHTGILTDDTEYYLALAYLQNDQPGQALPLFKKIKNNNQHLYNSRVSGWFLQKLKLLTWKKS